MALSGSVDFNQDARAIIEYALKKLRVLGANDAASGAEAEDARVELNILLKEWQQYPNLWRHTEGSITLVASTYSYSLIPVPHRVNAARYRDASAPARDLPMELLKREDYYDLPLKTTTGIPTEFYVDYQWATTSFLIWQALASVTTETVKYTYQKKFDDLDTLDDDVEIRSEHYSALGYGLAARLIDDYGRRGPTVDRIIGRAEVLFDAALDTDREDFVQFIPGYGTYG